MNSTAAMPAHSAAFVVLSIAGCCLLVAGCASTTLGKRGNQDGKPAAKTSSRAERRSSVIEGFEARRNRAQYDAALMRWNQGDAAGCETLLAAILERRPDDRDCRRLLADVCLDRNDLPAAEAHLRKLLEQDDDDAQSHHSLGLLLEESGRAAEAVRHFDRALALDPQNEVYILSREAAQQTLPRQ